MRVSVWRAYVAAGVAAVVANFLVLERVRAVTPLAQTFSAGVACWDGREISDELVARADRALYAAKAGGRNRVVSDDQVGKAPPAATAPRS